MAVKYLPVFSFFVKKPEEQLLLILEILLSTPYCLHLISRANRQSIESFRTSLQQFCASCDHSFALYDAVVETANQGVRLLESGSIESDPIDYESGLGNVKAVTRCPLYRPGYATLLAQIALWKEKWADRVVCL